MLAPGGMGDFLQDLRFAARLLRKGPGFTITVVVLLAVGIAANVLVFSVLNALLLRPLPVRRPEQLVRVVTVRPQIGPRSQLAHPVYENLQRARHLKDAFGAAEYPCSFQSGAGGPVRVYVHLVSENYFRALGVGAVHGRTLPADDHQGIPAVLSWQFWQRYFGGDPNVIGRPATLRGKPAVITGLLPRSTAAGPLRVRPSAPPRARSATG